MCKKANKLRRFLSGGIYAELRRVTCGLQNIVRYLEFTIKQTQILIYIKNEYNKKNESI